MRHVRLLFLSMFLLGGLGTGCRRSPDEVWNDTKTAGRHVGRGVDTMGGKQSSSRQVKDGSEFGYESSTGGASRANNDFVPLDDDKLGLQVGDAENLPAPKDSPGDPGSPVPGIEAFRDPAQDPELAPIFEHVHFEYNSSLIKGDENIKIVQKIADYMKNHPRLYAFVEGHCDKRGSAAYNMALGANRANAVRGELIQEGVSPDKIFTISYGKEKPLFEDEGEEFFRLNRRAQFKVYEK
jgi:peptidoglycan-associated lipoprotein